MPKNVIKWVRLESICHRKNKMLERRATSKKNLGHGQPWPWIALDGPFLALDGLNGMGCIPNRFQVGGIGKEGSAEPQKIVEFLEVENKAATVAWSTADQINTMMYKVRALRRIQSYKWVEPAWNIDCTNSAGSPVR